MGMNAIRNVQECNVSIYTNLIVIVKVIIIYQSPHSRLLRNTQSQIQKERNEMKKNCYDNIFKAIDIVRLSVIKNLSS